MDGEMAFFETPRSRPVLVETTNFVHILLNEKWVSRRDVIIYRLGLIRDSTVTYHTVVYLDTANY